jgi:aminopeptidase N
VRPALYHEINNFYTATVYEKGAEVVRMLKTMLGPELFRSGMDLYFLRHDGQAATVEQFIQCFADEGRTDLTQFMRWYAQAGTPEVAVTGSFDARAGTYVLEAAQAVPPTPGQPVKEPHVIPLAIGLVGADGHDLPLADAHGREIPRGVIVLKEPTQSFTFTGLSERPVLSLNRNFSAPIRLTANLSSEDLRFLAAHDSDPFNRWQALQTLATGLLVENVAALRAGKPAREDEALADALGAMLGDPALQPAFVALALTLPGEADIARDIGQDVDPDAIFAARKALRGMIGMRLGPALRDAYRRMSDERPYSPDAASAGRRALKNVSLDLLAAGGVAGIALAARQYHQADNMTDRMAALATLALHPVPERQAAIDDFYRRYESDPLIVDKWFALQATIPEAGTLDRVRALAGHPAFSLGNPNRVRSLIGAFAQMNQTQFNRADGAGYDFLADTVLALDPKNPQVAARLMTAFKSWRALEPARRARAEAALARVGAAPSLSRDVKDIVERSLAQS